MQKIAIFLTIFGCLIAFTWAISIPNLPFSDPQIYHQSATSLATGKGYPYSSWAPGYAFYISGFYFLFIPDPKAAFIANFLAYVALVIGVYLLGKLLYSVHTARWAAALTALYPGWIFYTTILASELFFSALLVWSFWSIGQGFKKENSKAWAILGGMLLGIAVLTRPQALIIPLALLLLIPVTHASIKRSVGTLCIVIISMIIVILPWTIRNYKVIGEPTIVSNNFGWNLWIGNHEGATGRYVDKDNVVEKEHLENLSNSEQDTALKEIAVQYIRQHPWQFMKLVVKRVYYTLRSESIGVTWNEPGIEERLGRQWIFPLKILENLGWYAILISFGVCLFFASWRESSNALLLWTMILLSIPFILFQAQDRFHLPLVPFMVMYISGNAGAIFPIRLRSNYTPK